MNLHIVLEPQEVAELKTLLDRALNTLPRQDWPMWVVELDEERKMKSKKRGKGKKCPG